MCSRVAPAHTVGHFTGARPTDVALQTMCRLSHSLCVRPSWGGTAHLSRASSSPARRALRAVKNTSHSPRTSLYSIAKQPQTNTRTYALFRGTSFMRFSPRIMNSVVTLRWVAISAFPNSALGHAKGRCAGALAAAGKLADLVLEILNHHTSCGMSIVCEQAGFRLRNGAETRKHSAVHCAATVATNANASWAVGSVVRAASNARTFGIDDVCHAYQLVCHCVIRGRPHGNADTSLTLCWAEFLPTF